MCRWMAWSGQPVMMDELLFKTEHGLVDQSLHSRLGAETTNGDGFGLGWYGSGHGPAIYHSVAPAWQEQTALGYVTPATLSWLGDPANLDVLFGAGFRMVGLVHFFDNELGGSAHGVGKGGLTAKGRDVVRRLEEQRMLLDLAHASPATIRDALAVATRPVVVSHTGVRGTCDNVRNLDDDALRGVARTGGLVGIGFWQTAVCGTGGRAVARAIGYAVGVAGIDHVALGSDFDGAVAEPFDATGLVEITDALLVEGFTEAQVEQVMGGNVFRLLSEALP